MFETIKEYFNIGNKGQKALNADIVSVVNNQYTSGVFTQYNRETCGQLRSLLSGYQYIAADIVAKTVASQKLRLYAAKPTRQSKFHKGKEEMIVRSVNIDDYRLKYLRGDNNEVFHDTIMHKTLSADESIVQILDHPAIDIVKNVNPYSNQWEFLYTLTMAIQFYGNSFFEKVRFTDGYPAELWYAPPQHMKIIQGKTISDFINRYEWGECFGSPKIIQPQDVLDFKMPGIGESQVYGMSKIEIVWKYINLIDSSLTFSKAIMDNTGRPDIILIAEDAKNNADGLLRLESKWNDRYYGPEQAGKMATVPGKVKVEVLPRSEFDFDNDTSLVRAIARGFGLPEYKVLPSSAIKANDSTQEKDFMKETVDSYLTLIEDVLNSDLLSEWDDSGDLFFAFDPVIKEDEEFKLKKQIAKTNAAHWTVNYVREQDGLEPIEGGDDGRYNGKSLVSMDTSPTAGTEPTQDEDKAMKEDVEATVKRIMDEAEVKKEIEEPVKVPEINININTSEEITEEEIVE